MSRDASITLDWAEGTHVFRLGWGELMKLQEAPGIDAGPYVVLGRLTSGAWRMEDIEHVIRLGLIGGGTTPAEASRLVRTYVRERPPMENLFLAQGVLTAGVIGAPEEEGAKKKAGRKRSQSTTSRTEKFASEPSSEPAPPSA